MPHKSKVVTALFLLILGGCVSNNRSSTEKSDEELAELYLQMGVGYFELGKDRVAMEKLQYALKLDDNNSEVYDALAVLYQRREEFDKAKRYFEKALDLAPHDPGTMNNYGLFLCDLGEYDKGMQYLKESLAMPINSRKWFALTNIGMCEYNHGSRASAESYLREALQQNSAYAPALQQMMIISYDKRNYMSAKGFLQRYLQIAKHNAKTLYYAMLIERSLGDTRKADEYKRQLVDKFPLSKEAKQIL